MFIIPDITGELSLIEGMSGLEPDDKQAKKR